MSVLNKIPYISALIGSMSAEELTTLTNLMNGSGNRAPLRRTVNPIDDASCPHITSEDKGVHMCSLTCNYTNFTGYLVYTDDYCALLSFTDSIVLKVFDIDVTNVGIRTIDEAITVLELRSVVWQEIHKNDGESGTVVVANPELDGTEDALTGLEVGNTKYKIAGGTKLYKHEIKVERTNWTDYFVKLIYWSNSNQVIDNYDKLVALHLGGIYIDGYKSTEELTLSAHIKKDFYSASQLSGFSKFTDIIDFNSGVGGAPLSVRLHISSVADWYALNSDTTLTDTVTEL